MGREGKGQAKADLGKGHQGIPKGSHVAPFCGVLYSLRGKQDQIITAEPREVSRDSHATSG